MKKFKVGDQSNNTKIKATAFIPEGMTGNSSRR